MTLENAKKLLEVKDLSAEFVDLFGHQQKATVLCVSIGGNESLPELMAAYKLVSENLVSEQTIIIADVTKYQDAYSLVHHITELIEFTRELQQRKGKSIALLPITGSQIKLLIRKITDLTGLDTEFIFGSNSTELLTQAKQRVREIALARR